MALDPAEARRRPWRSAPWRSGPSGDACGPRRACPWSRPCGPVGLGRPILRPTRAPPLLTSQVQQREGHPQWASVRYWLVSRGQPSALPVVY